jgi:hypothetical protein
MVHERISFNFVKIHLMLHYEETVRCFAHLVKNSSKTQGINHPKMCMGPYYLSKHNICYAQPILNNYSPIHILWMLLLHLRQLAKEGHWTPDIQQALQLYQPTGQIIVNICNHELVPVLENIPLSFRKDEGNIQVHGLRSHRRKGFFVQNEDHPMFNFPLIEYLYRYSTCDLNIPITNRRGIGVMHATHFNLLHIPLTNFQSFHRYDSPAHMLHCMDDRSFCIAEPRNDFVSFRLDEMPKADVGDLQPA